jgi:hypothetical protein
MSKQEIIKIFAAYPWYTSTDNNNKVKQKNTLSSKAIKEIITRIQKRLENLQENNAEINIPKLFYSRLRATSGSFVFESIRERMSNAYAIIFDITGHNANVMLELGIALELQQQLESSAKVFLIAQAEEFSDELLPSDLRGFFLTTYSPNKTKKNVVIGDSGSLVMRIVSDILELSKVSYIEESSHE